jgi:hypothetical protein
MRLTRRLAGRCDNGPCPAVYEVDDPDVVAIQGVKLAEDADLGGYGPVPDHEAVVLMPRDILLTVSAPLTRHDQATE